MKYSISFHSLKFHTACELPRLLQILNRLCSIASTRSDTSKQNQKLCFVPALLLRPCLYECIFKNVPRVVRLAHRNQRLCLALVCHEWQSTILFTFCNLDCPIKKPHCLGMTIYLLKASAQQLQESDLPSDIAGCHCRE